MNNVRAADDLKFPVKDVRSVVEGIVSQVLEGKVYDHEKAPEWIDTINSSVIKELHSFHIPFKFISTTVVMEKKLANLHCSCSALWDNVNDNNCVVPWESNYLFCLTTVFGVQI